MQRNITFPAHKPERSSFNDPPTPWAGEPMTPELIRAFAEGIQSVWGFWADSDIIEMADKTANQMRAFADYLEGPRDEDF